MARRLMSKAERDRIRDLRRTPLQKLLYGLGACLPARKWAYQHVTLERAWDKCKNGRWLLFLLETCDVDDPRRCAFWDWIGPIGEQPDAELAIKVKAWFPSPDWPEIKRRMARYKRRAK